MEYFSICFDVMCLAAQSAMHIVFVGRLTGKKERLWHFMVYFFLLCMAELVLRRFVFIENLGTGIQALVLYGTSRLVLKNSRSVSWIAAVLAIYISLLSTGMINSVQAVLFPNLVGTMLLYFFLVFSAAVSYLICACCYMAVLGTLSLKEGKEEAYIGLLMFPGMFFLAAEWYVLKTAYSQVRVVMPPEEYGKNLALLFLQILGLFALLCTLYAYRQVCRSFQAQAEMDSLAQAVKMQKIYISEAQIRHERTRAFHHDIKNHLSVLDGLLNKGETSKAKDYLGRLEMASAALSFPYQTGNPVVDILLGEKLGVARADGIAAEVSLVFPKECYVNDPDLCVIFANALDNAVRACRLVDGESYIRISGARQGDFYMLEFENSCPPETAIQEGTGLSNIRTAAEKYRGAMVTEKKGERFCLNVLLNISDS